MAVARSSLLAVTIQTSTGSLRVLPRRRTARSSSALSSLAWSASGRRPTSSYRTLGELGLAAFCEVVAFEYMLARLAGRIAAFLATHRGLGPVTLRWWTEHADVDVQHAAEGLEDLETYARYYGLADEDGLAIVELTLRENVFLRRYFRAGAPAEREELPCAS
jgi:hypothetical protein